MLLDAEGDGEDDVAFLSGIEIMPIINLSSFLKELICIWFQNCE